MAPLSIASALKLTRTGLQDVFIDVSPNKGALDHDLPMEAWQYQDPSKTMLRRMMYQDRSGIIKIYQDKFGIWVCLKMVYLIFQWIITMFPIKIAMNVGILYFQTNPYQQISRNPSASSLRILAAPLCWAQRRSSRFSAGAKPVGGGRGARAMGSRAGSTAVR